MKYLLDTNICIYIIKKQPVKVIDKFRNASLGDIGISSITLAELQYGVEKSQHKIKNQKALEEFILP
jgi:tRNA(fMet)-specific endonuclease VapC